MNSKTSNKIQISLQIFLVLFVSGSLAGLSVLLKVLHAIDPLAGVFDLLSRYPLWAIVAPVLNVVIFSGIYRGVGFLYEKWGDITDSEKFSGKLAIPFIFFAFWIIKPFVNYQRGIFTSTAILAVLTLILLTRKELRLVKSK